MICVPIGLLFVFLKSASCADVAPDHVKVGYNFDASQPVVKHATVSAIKKRHVTIPVTEIRSTTAVHPAFAVYQNAPIITRVYQQTAGLSTSPVASLVTSNNEPPLIAAGTTHPAVPVLGRIYHPATVVATKPTYGVVHATPAVSGLNNADAFHATPATVIVKTHPAFAAYKSAPAIMRAYQYAPGFSRVYHQISVVPPSVTHIYHASPPLSAVPVLSSVTKYTTFQAGHTLPTVATTLEFARYPTVPAFMRTYEYTPGSDFGYPTSSVVPPATAVSKLTTFARLNNAPEVTKLITTPVVTRTYQDTPGTAAAPLSTTVTKDTILQPAPPASTVSKYSTLPATPAATTLNTNAAFTRYQSVPAFMSSYKYTPGFELGYQIVSLVPPATAVSKLTTFANLNNAPEVTKFSTAPVVTQAHQDPPVVAAAPLLTTVTKDTILQPAPLASTVTKYSPLPAAPAAATVFTNAAFSRYQSVPAFMSSNEYTPGLGLGNPTLFVVPPTAAVSKLTNFASLSNAPEATKFATAPDVTETYQDPPIVSAGERLPTVIKDSILQVNSPAPAVTKYSTLPAAPAAATLNTNAAFTRYQSVPAFMSSNEYTPGFGLGNPTISVVPPATAVSKLAAFATLNNVPEVTKFSTAQVVTQTFQDPPNVAADSLLPLVSKDLISHAAPPVPTVTKDATSQAAPATATLIRNSAFTRYLSVPGFMSSYEHTPEFGLSYPTVPLAPPATAISKVITFANLNNPPEAAKSTTVPVITQTYQDPPVIAAGPHLPSGVKDFIPQAAPPVFTVTKYSTLQAAPAAGTPFTNAAFTRYQSVPAFMSSNEYTPGFGLGNPTISVVPPATAVSKLAAFGTLNNVPEVTKFSTAQVVTQTYQDPPNVAADSLLPLVSKDLISHAAPPVPTVTKDATSQAAPATPTLIRNSAFTRYLSVPGFMSSYEHAPEFGLGYPTVPLAPPATAVSKLTTFASLNIAPEAAKSTTVPVVTQTYQNPQVVAAAPALPTFTKDSNVQVAPLLPAVTKYSILPAAPAAASLNTNAAFTRYQSVPAFMSSNEYTPGFGVGNPTISVFPPAAAVSKLTAFTSLNNVPEVTQFSTAPVVTQIFQNPPVAAADSHVSSVVKDFISQAAPPVSIVTKYSTLQAAPAAGAPFTNAAFTRYQSVPAFMSSNEYTPGIGLGNPTIYVSPPATAVSKLTTFASVNAAPEAAKSTAVPVVTQTYQNPQVVALAPALPTVTRDSILQVNPPAPVTRYSILAAAPAAAIFNTNSAFTRYQSVPAFMSSNEHTPGFDLGYPTVPFAPPATVVSKLTPISTLNTAPAVTKLIESPVESQTSHAAPSVAAAPPLPTVIKYSSLQPAAPVPLVTKYSTLQTNPPATTVSSHAEFTRYQSVPAFMSSYEKTPGFDLNYPTVSLVPPSTAVSKLPTFPSHNAAPGVTKFTAAPVGTQPYQVPPVLAAVPHLPTVTRYSSLQGAPGAETVATKAAFTRYQSVPAFMSSYQYTPGFGHGYHTASAVLPALAVPKLANYASFNTAHQVGTFNEAPVVSRVYHAGQVVAPILPAPAVSKHTTFQLAPTVSTADTSTGFDRYQSVPAFMRSYQYSSGFEQGHHTVSAAPQLIVPSKLTTYPNNKKATGFISFTGAPAIHHIYQSSPAVATVAPVPTVTKYSTLQGIPAVATVARNTAFARYQSVPAFMRSYQYTPGFGSGYHTVSVVPPGTDSSKVQTDTAYNAAPAVHQIYQTAPALPEVAIYPSGPPVSAVTTFATSPQLAHYPRVQDFTRSAKYSFGLGQNYHTVAVVPPSTTISKVSTYSPRNPTPIVTSYAATPIVHPVYRAPQVVPTGPSVSRLTKYSSFQSYPAVSTVVSKPGFARYQSVPAFMSSYQPTPGYGRSYHTVSVVPPATAVPKLSTYASYNPAPAVTTYSAAAVVRPIHHASPAVFTAPAVSSLTKYSSFQSYPAVSTDVSKPAFTRYQSVPAFMSSYQSTPRFGRGYHTVSVVPPATAVSKLPTYASYNPAPAVPTYTTTPVVRPIYHPAPAIPTAPAVSSLTKYSSFQSSNPAFVRYQSVPAFMSSYPSTPGYGRSYHTVSVVPPATGVSKLSTYASYNPAPAVTTYSAAPVVRPIYHAAPAVFTAPAVSSLTKYSSFQSYPSVSTVMSKPAFNRYQSVPAFMRSYQSTPGFGRSYHTVSVVPPATVVSKLRNYASYNPSPEVQTYPTTPVVRPIYHAAPAVSITPAVSTLTKYSSFESLKPAFVRYQSVPAFMSSYHSTPGYGRSYHTVSVIPPATAVSKFSTYSSYNPAPAVPTYSTTPVVRPIYSSAPAVPIAPAVSSFNKYTSFQSLKPGFVRYQSVPAFMSSYHSTPGYGRSYHTVSVVPPAAAVSKLSTYSSYNPAPALPTYTTTPVVRRIHHATSAVPIAPAVSSFNKYTSFQSLKPGFVRYQSVPAFMSSYQSTPGFGRSYHSLSVVPPVTAVSKLSTYASYNPATGISVITDPAFIRYHAAPAVMRAYTYAPGFTRFYNSRPIVSTPVSLSQLTKHTSYNVAPARPTYNTDPAISPIFQASPVAGGVSSLPSALQPYSHVASAITDPAFIRYQSAPAVMRAYHYAPGFTRVYHSSPSVTSAALIPHLTRPPIFDINPAVTVSKLAPATSVVAHPVYPPSLGVTQVHPSTSVTSHVVRPSAVVSAPGYATVHAAPAVSSVTKYSTFHAAPVVSPVITHPAFVAYQSAPFITRIYHTVPVVTRIYYSVPLTTVGPVVSYRKTHNVVVSPAATTVHVAPSVSISRSSPVTTTIYGGSSAGAASPVVATVLHDAPSLPNAGIGHSSTHVTVNSAPAVTTAHVPGIVSHRVTHEYDVGALGFGDGLPTYGHNYAYGLDGLNYRELLRKRK